MRDLRRNEDGVAKVIGIVVVVVAVAVALFFILGPSLSSCPGSGSLNGSTDYLSGSATVGFVQLYANTMFIDSTSRIQAAFPGLQTFFQKYGLSLSLGPISSGYQVHPSCTDSTGEPNCMISAWAKANPTLFNATVAQSVFTVWMIEDEWPYTTGTNGGPTGLGWVEVYSGSPWGYTVAGSVDIIIAKDGIAGGLGLGDTFRTAYAQQCDNSLGTGTLTGNSQWSLSQTYLCSYELGIMHFGYTYRMTWDFAAYGLLGGTFRSC